MAVGDLVRRSALAWDLGLVRGQAKVAENDSVDLLNSSIIEVKKQRTRLYRRLLSSIGFKSANKPSQSTEKLTLFKLLDQRHGIVTYGTPSGGQETIAVPFTNVAITTSSHGKLPHGFPADRCREIEREIEARFEKSIDPTTDVRIGSSATGELADDAIFIFTGDGVFVPHYDEKPVGSLRAGPSLESLQDVRIFRNLPAGIYRGQTAISFGASELVAPARIPQLALPDDAYLHFQLPLPNGASRTGQQSLKLIAEKPFGTHQIRNRDNTAADALFSVKLDYAGGANGRAEEFYVEVTFDARPSRLLHEQPMDRPAFEIAGFRIGDDDLTDGVDAFWFDLDARGRPINSAVLPREWSVVYDGRRMRRYSWRRFGYDRQPPVDYRISPRGNGFEFRHTDNRPFGYLAAPASSATAVFQDNWWTANGYHLDWLDHVGCVENALGSHGLAAIHAGRGAEMPSYEKSPAGEFFVGPLILRRAGTHKT